MMHAGLKIQNRQFLPIHLYLLTHARKIETLREMKQPETKEKTPWPQSQSAPNPFPGAGPKPIIRPSTRLGSRAQIPGRPAFLSKQGSLESTPPQVAAAVEQLAQTQDAKAAERSDQMAKLADAIVQVEKGESSNKNSNRKFDQNSDQTSETTTIISNVSASEDRTKILGATKSTLRTITIPDVPMVMIVGHSVRGTKTIPFPSLLPEFSSSEKNATLGRVIFIPLLVLIATGVLGWNAFRQDRTSPNGEIVDRVSQHAMAPNRTMPSSYDDEPTRVRTKNSGVPIYMGPGVQFSTIGELKPTRLYPILEQRSSWVKIATDQTHFAWVDQSSIELIR
jgi:hypothetical protein